MNRPKDPALREALLARAVHYVLRHGVGALSLRPLAKEIGTTARMLIHHFGSKETLIGLVLVAIEKGFAERTTAAVGDERNVGRTLMRMWSETATPAMDTALRAVFEVWGHALVHTRRYEAFLGSLTEPWIEMLRPRFEQAGRPPAEAVVLATLAVGAFQGLQLVRLTSGDGARSAAALEALTQWLDRPPPQAPSRKASPQKVTHPRKKKRAS
jgi:AcrR family transcriptional regulator